MRFSLSLVLPVLLLSPLCVSAAGPEGRIGAPVAGYVPDPARRGILPLRGVPGALTLGDPLDLGLKTSAAFVAPGQDFALGVDSADAAVRVLSWQDGDLQNTLLPLAAAPGRVVFSPTGSTAGLYGNGSGRLQVFTQLPRKALLAHEIDLAGLPGEATAAAISDDGELVLLLTAEGDGAALWLSRSGTAPTRLDLAGSPAAVAWRRGSSDALIGSRDGRIDLMEGLASAPNLRNLSPPDERLSDPVAVQFSADGDGALIATRRGTIARLGLQTESSAFVSCDCEPSGLFPLDSQGLVRLTDLSERPLLLLDTANPQPRVWFVPALRRGMLSERGAQ